MFLLDLSLPWCPREIPSEQQSFGETKGNSLFILEWTSGVPCLQAHFNFPGEDSGSLSLSIHPASWSRFPVLYQALSWGDLGVTWSWPLVGVRVVRQGKFAHTFDKSGDRSALESREGWGTVSGVLGCLTSRQPRRMERMP